MFWFGKVSSVIVWFGIIWYGGATMLKNIDSNILQNAAVIIWQKPGATKWQNAGNLIISNCVV